MPDSVDLTLSDDLETFRHLGHLAIDLATDYLERLRQRPVFLPMTPDKRLSQANKAHALLEAREQLGKVALIP